MRTQKYCEVVARVATRSGSIKGAGETRPWNSVKPSSYPCSIDWARPVKDPLAVRRGSIETCPRGIHRRRAKSIPSADRHSAAVHWSPVDYSATNHDGGRL